MSKAKQEICAGKRFAFGANWSRFLKNLTEERIINAEKSLVTTLGLNNLENKSFLDVGCGSGLFSLAARRLGAKVVSFDYDSKSVACTNELKRRYFPNDPLWKIEEGSVLDQRYLIQLGKFDIVYSWGVLHHTGNMWQAMANIAELVADEGRLFISIYNDQGAKSRHWAWVKRNFNKYSWLRPILLVYTFALTWGPNIVLDFCRLKPFESWRKYSQRGMSPLWDLIDWAGGWPYETATPEAVFRFYRDRGFQLQELVTRQGLGCNEFVFIKKKQ